MQNNSKFNTQNSKLVIRASEIGEYSYCSRAWWYKHVVKVEPPDIEYNGRLMAGTKAHARHARTVATATTFRAIGILLAALGLLMLGLTLLLMRP
jgi:CRISPR/Cas system-associated exonuclease Cas4 (RecB family)